MSNPDPLLPSLLERTPADELDLANQEERQLHRMHSLFSIYPIQQVSRENMIIASNSHWLSCKRENIKETDNVHCRGQLRALETEKNSGSSWGHRIFFYVLRFWKDEKHLYIFTELKNIIYFILFTDEKYV